MIRDDTIIRQLATRRELPSVAQIVTEWRIGWQQAARIRDALREQETPPEPKRAASETELWL